MMKKRYIITIISSSLFIIILLIVSMIYFNYEPSSYEITISREYNSEDERLAIETAESYDYGSLFERERLNYSWCNFIDNNVIEFYQMKILEREEAEHRSQNSLIYEAIAVKMNHCDVDYYDDKIQVTSENNTFNDYFWSHGRDSSLFAILNETYRRICWYPNEHIRLNYSSIIFVRMELDYDTVSGPLSGIFSHCLQYIIFDLDLEPLFIIIKPSSHLIS